MSTIPSPFSGQLIMSNFP